MHIYNKNKWRKSTKDYYYIIVIVYAYGIFI